MLESSRLLIFAGLLSALALIFIFAVRESGPELNLPLMEVPNEIPTVISTLMTPTTAVVGDKLEGTQAQSFIQTKTAIRTTTTIATPTYTTATPTTTKTAIPTTTTTATPTASEIEASTDEFPAQAELEELVLRANKELKVFIYEIPDDVMQLGDLSDPVKNCFVRFVEQGRDHFQHEVLVPEYFRQKNTTLRTDNWEEADLLIVPHFFMCLWIGFGNIHNAQEHVVSVLNWVHNQPSCERHFGHDHVLVFFF